MRAVRSMPSLFGERTPRTDRPPVAQGLGGRAARYNPGKEAPTLICRVRLVQQVEPVQTVLGEHVAVARGQQHRHVRQPALQELGQGDPAHAGHHHVGEHGVEAQAVLAELVQSVLGIGRPRRPIAEVLQDLGGEAPDLDVVLHHEHALAVTGRERCILVSDRRLHARHALDLRQVEGEGRALPDRAVHVDVAARLLGEAEHLGETEARALADFLQGGEGLEDAG